MNPCPIPGAQGECQPEGLCTGGVLILGEALGEDEVADGCKPFRPHAQAGSVLERAIRRIACTRDMFVLYNAVPTHPPKNYIAQEIEREAIAWGHPYVRDVVRKYRPRCILALGNTAIHASTGLAGRHLGVSHLCGYLLPSIDLEEVPVVPCFHPSYLRRGKMSHFGVLMRCLRLALLVAREGRKPHQFDWEHPPAGYIVRPTEEEANEFAREAERHSAYVAYDIETMYSTDEEDAEERPDAIRSIQFSLRPASGIYMPWRARYIDAAKRVLASNRDKINWNGWRFDDPLLKQNGCVIGGRVIDLMWAWHHYQPDLPRGLQFACAMQGPNIYSPTHSWPAPWKHLDAAAPAFYGIMDTDCLQWLVSYQ